MKYLLFAILFLGSCGMARSQAFDGYSDKKICLGYTNIEGLSAIDLQLDYGLLDWLSAGSQINYIFIKKEPSKSYDFIDHINFAIFVRAQFSGIFKMSSKIAPYAGVDFNIYTIGVHGGIKYNFSEYLGIYAQLQHGLFNAVNLEREREKFFGKNLCMSIGMTYNIF